MAKQTFTTGQVLTAAQMTSLQQTAMGGGAASAKTASYTLVAADAGTTISMTSTSATTITVNTGLFAAGDTVLIQNLGTGNCTITAGTATVNTAGSLILPQYDAGILYFVSASSAVFYDYIQVGATSPLTTKGDLYTYSTSDTRLPIGTDGYTLVADSTQSTGLKWAAPGGGGYNTATFRDEKSSGTAGGTFTAGAWRTRDLNTTVYNAITSASLSSNQISLPAGTYYVDIIAPCYNVGHHQARLYNITDSATTILGISNYTRDGATATSSLSIANGSFTIAGTKTFEVQQRCDVTASSNGFGVEVSWGTEVYATITINKVV